MNMRHTLRSGLTLLALAAASLLPAQTLYWGGGASNISDGTALPTTIAGSNGTWDNTTENWSNAFSPTVYDPWTTGAVANLGYFTDPTTGNAVITVNGNKTISGIVASLTPASSFNREFQLNGAAAGTILTLTGPTATFLVSSSDSTRGMSSEPTTPP